VVNALMDNVQVPNEYIEDGRIVLNVAPSAIRNLLIANDHVGFNARFTGVPHEIYTPIKAVTAIYAKENGRGMVFKEDEDDDHPPGGGPNNPSGGSDSDKRGGRPKLTVVK